jgi:polyisoprenoid-binding protein YceI
MIRPFLVNALLASAGVLAAAPASASATTYTLEPNYTQVVFRWDHLGFSFPTAQVTQGAGELVFDPMHPEASSVKVTIPLSTLASGVPDLDEHLASEDFFERAKYPTATFTSTKVQPGKAKDRFVVTGNLTIHGVTKPLVLDVTLLRVGSNARTNIATVGFNATGMLKRSDFGLGAFVPQVGDEISLQVTTQGAESKAYAAYLRDKKEKEKK